MQETDKAQSGTNAGGAVVPMKSFTASFCLHLCTTVEKPLSHEPGSPLKAAHIAASRSCDMKIFLSSVQQGSQGSLLFCPENARIDTPMYTLQLTQEIANSFASKRLCKSRTKGVLDHQEKKQHMYAWEKVA